MSTSRLLSPLLLTAGLTLSPVLALAQEPSPEEANLDSLDRYFPLSESAATPPTDVRAQTNGSASNASTPGDSYGISQRVEMTVVRGLALRAGGEMRMGSGRGFTPEAQVKYQFFRQAEDGFNGSAGVRYKQLGFQSDGGEAEVFFAAGKRWGRMLGTANLVAGTGVSKREMDIEGHLGMGYLLGDRLVVGTNVRFQQEVDDAEIVKSGGREFEMVAGGLAGYGFGPAELSLLAGWYLPRATMASGPLAMLQLGLNF